LTEPEYARALLAGSLPPPATPASDQYSVAALVYTLLSGRHYLDFSYGREEMLRQVSEQTPIPLAGRGLSTAGALNAVLMRALEKDPAARFPNMTEMASAFRDATRSLSQPARDSLAVQPDTVQPTKSLHFL
jgi:serine/threonine-protein kinase